MTYYCIVEREGADPVLVGPFTDLLIARDWRTDWNDENVDAGSWDWYAREPMPATTPHKIQEARVLFA